MKVNIYKKWDEIDVNDAFQIDGKLVSTDNGQPFQFYVFPNKEDNYTRYHAIGRLVDNVIYDRMEKGLGLRRITIPVCIFVFESELMFVYLFC
jgi:hypothetical protein